MSKKDHSYSDAMNDWAAKQSFLRNKRNRFLHPNPELPMPLQVLGYLFRVAVVVFILWLIGARVARKAFNSSGYNEAIVTELKTFMHADEIETARFAWADDRGSVKRVTATGGDSAIYHKFDAVQLAYKVPIFDRLRKRWVIDELRIEELTVDLRSGGKTRDFAKHETIPLIAAGLVPDPDFSEMRIKRVISNDSDIRWGLGSSTRGGIDGSTIDAFTDTSAWMIELTGGSFRQNWLSGLAIEKMRVKRLDGKVQLSDGEVRLGSSKKSGTMEGSVTIAEIPRVDLQVKLPQAYTRDLIPGKLRVPSPFDGELDLDLKFTGSINTLSGVETAGEAKITSGTFSRVPVLEAVDQMLNLTTLRIFTVDEGKISFTTSGGKLTVSSFECRQKARDILLRGDFVYTPAPRDETGEPTGPDEISGQMKLGVKPSLVEGNPLAEKYFTEATGGKVWMDIPLSGRLSKATSQLRAEILAGMKQ